VTAIAGGGAGSAALGLVVVDKQRGKRSKHTSASRSIGAAPHQRNGFGGFGSGRWARAIAIEVRGRIVH
jgi:hypothetical protein